MYGASAGRTSLTLLVAFALGTLGAAVWWSSRSTPEPVVPAEHAAASPTPPASTADAGLDRPPHNPDGSQSGSSDTPSRSTRIAEPTSGSSSAEQQAFLCLALQDESGRPLAGEFSIEYAADEDGRLRTYPLESVRGPEATLAVPHARNYRVRVGNESIEGKQVVAASVGTSEPPFPFVLRALRTVSGTVLDAQEQPLEHVHVAVVLKAANSFQAASCDTDFAGRFRLRIVRDPGRLYIGDAQRPWVPGIDIEGGAAPIELDPIRVTLFAATFLVQTADGNPAAEAKLVGTGLDGGQFNVATDADGRVRVERMPRGRWRVNATLEPHGRENRAVDIPLEVDEPVVLVLPR